MSYTLSGDARSRGSSFRQVGRLRIGDYGDGQETRGFEPFKPKSGGYPRLEPNMPVSTAQQIGLIDPETAKRLGQLKVETLQEAWKKKGYSGRWGQRQHWKCP